jgi:hypothetical protein
VVTGLTPRSAPLYVDPVPRVALRILSPLAAAAVIASLGGCGSSTVTKRDFVARANAICNNTLRQIRSIGPAAPGTSKHQALAAYLARLLPIVESEAKQLHALKQPSQTDRQKAQLNGYFAALDGVVRGFRQLQSAAAQGDAQAIANAQAALRASPVARRASSYGLHACASPTGTAV